MSSILSGHHLAMIIPSKGSGLELAHRATPTPGPNEVLIEVKAIALNPVDHFQRDTSLMITTHPTVLGSDVAGTIISTGSSVSNPDLKPGTRVAAYASAFFKQSDPDYGAFQTRVLTFAENVVPLPHGMSFKEASILPMAVATAWAGWYTIGVARDTMYTAKDKKGMLVWGAASSVGSAALQVARSMGFIVYATASEKHHAYLKELGASKMFDYKSEDVVGQIVKAAKEDGVMIQLGYDAVNGVLEPCMEILKQLKGEGKAMLASAAPLPEDYKKVDGVEAKFVWPPVDDKAQKEHFHFIFNVWLKEKLANGEFVPSPKVQLVEGGLGALDKALNELKNGVSGKKIVIEI